MFLLRAIWIYLATCWQYRRRSLPIVPAKRVVIYREDPAAAEWIECGIVVCDGVENFGHAEAPDDLLAQIIESVKGGWQVYYFENESDGSQWMFQVQD